MFHLSIVGDMSQKNLTFKHPHGIHIPMTSLIHVYPRLSHNIISPCHIPDAPCMEYLPTFTPKMAPMYVNIPYMEHLGIDIPINIGKHSGIHQRIIKGVCARFFWTKMALASALVQPMVQVQIRCRKATRTYENIFKKTT